MKRKRYIGCALVLCATVSLSICMNTHGAGIPKAEHVPFLGLRLILEIFKDTVLSVQIKEDEEKYKIIGSGFACSPDGKAVSIVTCKHLVDQARAKKKSIYLGVPTDQGYQRFAGKVTYIDEKEDFAFLKIIIPVDKRGVHIFKKYIALEHVGSRSTIEEGKGLLIIGYPLGLGFEFDSDFPVVKIGIISQYTQKNHFLIDANINPGNSGSPVISIKDKKVIGMITSYKPDKIELFDKNGNLVALIPYNSGLAQAVTLKRIREQLMLLKQ